MDSLSVDTSLHIRFEGATHIGTGRSEGLLDRTIRRDGAGEPYVPGSALKGALRMTAERAVGQLNEISELEPEWRLGLRRRGDRIQDERCLAPRPEEMCQSHDPCVVCRLFGNVFVGTHLRVGDAFPQSENSSEQSLPDQPGETSSPGAPPRRRSTDVLTRLRMDRRRKGAEAGALFTSEYDHPATSYASALTGTVPATPIESDGGLPAELVLLAAAVAATDQIGGEATTGHGQCRIQFGDASLISSGERPEAQESGPPYPLGTLLDEKSLRALAWHRFMS
jgi:CRISPR/Cas system CSM-associated protein Csm3 (group 7 of RAMP superfamily)